MARVKFTQNYDYRPSGAPGVTIAYKAGKSYSNVKREAADLAVMLGKGEELRPPASQEAGAGGGAMGGSPKGGVRRRRRVGDPKT